ncbi:MAG: galactokinase [Oscillospiraceae bacterium]|nr:galactokinase [Oscillospiraceae bacterium]
MEARIVALLEQFHSLFGEKEARVWSAPGRTEIGGNHTDHQLGKVVAASVDMDMLAAAAKNGTNIVNVKSEGYDMISFTLDTLTPVKSEEGTTLSLIRGICAEAAARGFEIGGFDACITSNVLQGSGLSSSAAFEVLIGAVVNGLFCESSLTATDLAIMGQKAENVFYGKPCGLMDEMASAWGGIIAIDFADPAAPVVTPVDFDFASAHHSLCMINLRSDHADLSDEYAAIPGELRKVSAHFGKKALREVDEAAFYKAMPELRKEAGDRAVLRAVHIFNENRRVDRIVEALRAGDFDRFLATVRESGRSSWVYLQNVVVCGSTQDQAAAIALALCEKILGERGAFRIHGGGFGGTVQAFVPDDLLDAFRAGIDEVFGPGSCQVMHIRPVGFTEIRLS